MGLATLFRWLVVLAAVVVTFGAPLRSLADTARDPDADRGVLDADGDACDLDDAGDGLAREATHGETRDGDGRFGRRAEHAPSDDAQRPRQHVRGPEPPPPRALARRAA